MLFGKVERFAIEATFAPKTGAADFDRRIIGRVGWWCGGAKFGADIEVEMSELVLFTRRQLDYYGASCVDARLTNIEPSAAYREIREGIYGNEAFSDEKLAANHLLYRRFERSPDFYNCVNWNLFLVDGDDNTSRLLWGEENEPDAFSGSFLLNSGEFEWVQRQFIGAALARGGN